MDIHEYQAKELLAGFGVPAIPAAALGMSLTAAAILAFVFPRAPPPALEKVR